MNQPFDNPRRFTPGDGEAPGFWSSLSDDASGDWAWKPERDRAVGDRMVTYRPTRHPLEGIRFFPHAHENA